MIEIHKSQSARAAAVLDASERAALKTLVARVGYRSACEQLRVSRATITTAQLGGRLNRGTAIQIRLALAVPATVTESAL